MSTRSDYFDHFIALDMTYIVLALAMTRPVKELVLDSRFSGSLQLAQVCFESLPLILSVVLLDICVVVSIYETKVIYRLEPCQWSCTSKCKIAIDPHNRSLTDLSKVHSVENNHEELHMCTA